MENTGNGVKCNREEAVKIVGEKHVDAVERHNCEYYREDGMGTQHWTAHEGCPGKGEDGVDVTITAHYFVTDDEFINPIDGEPYDDLSNIDWRISYYTIS